MWYKTNSGEAGLSVLCDYYRCVSMLCQKLLYTEWDTDCNAVRAGGNHLPGLHGWRPMKYL